MKRWRTALPEMTWGSWWRRGWVGDGPLNPGSVQSQTGQNLEKPDLGKAVLDSDRRVGLNSLLRSLPTQTII